MMKFHTSLFGVLLGIFPLVYGHGHGHGHGHAVSHASYGSSIHEYNSLANNNFEGSVGNYRIVRYGNKIIPSYTIITKSIKLIIPLYIINLILFDSHEISINNYTHSCILTLELNASEFNKTYDYIIEELNNNNTIDNLKSNGDFNYLLDDIKLDCYKRYEELDFIYFILILFSICCCCYCCIAFDSKKRPNNLY